VPRLVFPLDIREHGSVCRRFGRLACGELRSRAQKDCPVLEALLQIARAIALAHGAWCRRMGCKGPISYAAIPSPGILFDIRTHAAAIERE